MVEAVEPGGVAERAGMQVEDVITAINQKPVHTIEQAMFALKKVRPHTPHPKRARSTLEVSSSDSIWCVLGIVICLVCTGA